MTQKVKVAQVVEALNKITGGRLPKDLGEVYSGTNPFVVIKSSNLPGKAIMEVPGFVCGDPEKEIKKLAVIMTLTESKIELAGETGVDAIVAHHPVADAANSGGVLLKTYLALYGISVFELHEAFHGLHPGISFLHGHAAHRVEILYGGIPGNCLFVGKALDEVKTLGDVLDRIRDYLDVANEEKLLEFEKQLKGCSEIYETNVHATGKILLGTRDSQVKNIIHIFPHTGFTAQHLESIKKEHPELDTVLASISRVKLDNTLVEKSKELGLNFIIGNSHATEILENGLPLAKALKKLLPTVEVVLFRERVTSFPVDEFGSPSIQEYSEMIADKYLVKK